MARGGLGNRFVLADQRRTDMRNFAGTRIKSHERLQPVAPSVLDDRLDGYSVNAARDPFMQQVYLIHEERRGAVPSVTRVGGSGRIQTVSARTTTLDHALTTAFDALAGTPVVLNPPFGENEPTVDTPAQASGCFLRTQMHALAVSETVAQRAPR